jgi:putative transposase
MSGPPPTVVTLTDSQHRLLERLVRRHTSPQRLVRRAQIILTAADGLNNEQIAQRLGLTRGTVRTWRDRWAHAADELLALEQAGVGEAMLTAHITALLADAPRPGAPASFSAEQIVQLVALACTDPQDSGRPVTHWTPTELADEATKRQLVPSISPRSVGRFLKRGRSEAASGPRLAVQ